MRSAILISCVLLLCACSAAAPPPAADSARAAAAKPPARQGLSKAMHDPLDRAKEANAPVEDADKAHDKALEDAGG